MRGVCVRLFVSTLVSFKLCASSKQTCMCISLCTNLVQPVGHSYKGPSLFFKYMHLGLLFPCVKKAHASLCTYHRDVHPFSGSITTLPLLVSEDLSITGGVNADLSDL